MNRRKFLKSLSAIPAIAALPLVLKQEKEVHIGIDPALPNGDTTVYHENDPWKKAFEPGVLAWKGEMKSAVLNENWVTKLI